MDISDLNNSLGLPLIEPILHEPAILGNWDLVLVWQQQELELVVVAAAVAADPTVPCLVLFLLIPA